MINKKEHCHFMWSNNVVPIIRWGRALLANLLFFSSAILKTPTFYGIRRCCTVFSIARHFPSSTPKSSERPLSYRDPHHNLVWKSLPSPPHLVCVNPNRSPWFGHPTNIWWLRIMKLSLYSFVRSSVTPSPLGSKNSTLESPQPNFFPLR